ncbi:Gfo/Idh/MocA family protein [Candidatus Enterococcus murrayae]|uniref:Gfo/Idh/MocA family oxidoreductase n=1 Tax=Candidatus Enterococcus murrayae TaxID=2815321 RepID=A0ABS3HH76_9ENTE|nr:Gfo/Idh/MocA family oxidoreductase [Enterococcus sp. MJM16]MBO0452265.1 Gfo/Idh/MocA family oxidoreductase [Enterococcus sp. MJM16]
MKLGLLGAGMIVHDLLSFVGEIKELEIAAICATPAESARIETLAQEHGIKEQYTDYDEMLKNTEIDTIYVGVPNHLHYMFTKKALLADKHVICEKPFTANYQEAVELAELAKERELMVLEGVSTRFLPNVLKIKELLPTLGEIKIVSANYSQYSSRYDAFKQGNIQPAFDLEKAGGALMDLNIYNINLMVTLFGATDNVSYQANIQKGIDTSGILSMDYGDFKAVCIAAKDCKAPIVTSIQGDKGCIIIEDSANIVAKFKLLMNDSANEEVYELNQGKHRMYHEFVAFCDIIDNQKTSEADKLMQVSLETMKIQTQARRTVDVIFPSDVSMSNR